MKKVCFFLILSLILSYSLNVNLKPKPTIRKGDKCNDQVIEVNIPIRNLQENTTIPIRIEPYSSSDEEEDIIIPDKSSECKIESKESNQTEGLTPKEEQPSDEGEISKIGIPDRNATNGEESNNTEENSLNNETSTEESNTEESSSKNKGENYISKEGEIIGPKLPFEYVPKKGWWHGWNVIPKSFWVNSKFKPGNEFIILRINPIISASPEGKVSISSKENDLSTLFSIEFVGQNIIQIRSYYGGYLSIDSKGIVTANSRTSNADSQFTVLQTNKNCQLDDANYIFLRSSSGKYLTIRDGKISGENDVSNESLFRGSSWNENDSLCNEGKVNIPSRSRNETGVEKETNITETSTNETETENETNANETSTNTTDTGEGGTNATESGEGKANITEGGTNATESGEGIANNTGEAINATESGEGNANTTKEAINATESGEGNANNTEEATNTTESGQGKANTTEEATNTTNSGEGIANATEGTNNANETAANATGTASNITETPNNTTENLIAPSPSGRNRTGLGGRRRRNRTKTRGSALNPGSTSFLEQISKTTNKNKEKLKSDKGNGKTDNGKKTDNKKSKNVNDKKEPKKESKLQSTRTKSKKPTKKLDKECPYGKNKKLLVVNIEK